MIARRTFHQGAPRWWRWRHRHRRMYVRDSFAQQVPNSAGTEPAKLKAPPGACGLPPPHLRRSPLSARDAGRPDHSRRARRGIPPAAAPDRNEPQHRGDAVGVCHRQPRDARCHCEARAERARRRRPPPDRHGRRAESPGRPRHRGIRFSITDPATAATSIDMIEPFVEARARARLARADQYGPRPDRRGRSVVESPALHDRVRFTWGTSAARRAEPSGSTTSSASWSTRAARGSSCRDL